MSLICSHRWTGPRVDIPATMPVHHICVLELGHDLGHLGYAEMPHRCCCGTYYDEKNLEFMARVQAIIAAHQLLLSEGGVA